MTRKSTLQFLAGLFMLTCAIVAHAGDIFFTADARLSADRDEISGALDIRLQSSEWIYNPGVFVRGEGPRRQVAQFPTWEQGEAKHIEFALPSPHRLAGDYDLLVEIHFQDMGGALLSANLAVRYQVREHSLLADAPVLAIDSTRVSWDLKGHSEDATTLYAPAPPFVTAQKNTYLPSDTSLGWVTNAQIPARPNWRYPHSARLDFVENGVHGSRVLQWTIVTDDTGALIPAPTAQQTSTAQALPIEFSAQASLTASPGLMEGSAQLLFSQYGPLRHVVITTPDAMGQPVTLGARSEWLADTPFDVSFNYALNHHFPGAYFFFMNVAFDDAEGFHHSAPLTLEYTVDRAVTQVEPPTVQLDQGRLTWQTGGADPAHIGLQVTTSPAWAALDLPLRPTDHALTLSTLDKVRTVPNWRYPQLARVTWSADGAHFSAISEWVLVTNSQGQWALEAVSDTNAAAPSERPWWRRQGTLWFAAIVLVGLALIFGVLKRDA